jgi:hypothetical protein
MFKLGVSVSEVEYTLPSQNQLWISNIICAIITPYTSSFKAQW